MIYDTNTQSTYKSWTNESMHYTTDKHSFFMLVLLYNLGKHVFECIYDWNYETIVKPFTVGYKPGEKYSYPEYYHNNCNHPNIDNNIVFTSGNEE